MTDEHACLGKIDKGSPGAALYLGTCIHSYGNCNGILYIK